MAPSKKRDAATSSAGGKALLKQWRPLHEWRRFGCISDSCYGQIFAQPAHEDKSWKCAGCGLQHHHACELPPEDGSLVCGRCVELKENWRREREQQQPTVQVVQATAVLGGGGAPRSKRVDAAQQSRCPRTSTRSASSDAAPPPPRTHCLLQVQRGKLQSGGQAGAHWLQRPGHLQKRYGPAPAHVQRPWQAPPLGLHTVQHGVLQ